MGRRYKNKRLKENYVLEHFRCDCCGTLFDLDEPINHELNQKIAEITGFQVTHYQTEFRGLCKDCQQK
jgi:Fur family peroxide stress response transcriptional regulator